MEEITVKGFCDFCRNNIPLVIAVSITLFFTYGIRLFWHSIGIDTESFMADKSGALKWSVSIGRFGYALLSKFWYIREFNPYTAFFTAFCLIWFFTISWCYIIAIFSRDTVKNNKLIPFALMFMTTPIWAELSRLGKGFKALTIDHQKGVLKTARGLLRIQRAYKTIAVDNTYYIDSSLKGKK